MGFLEGFQCVHRIPAELAVNRAVEVPQFLQPLLQRLHIRAFVSVFKRLFRYSHSGRGRRRFRHLRGRCGVGSDGVGGINGLLSLRAGRSVCLEAVLFLERAHRSDGVRVVCACRLFLVVAQFLKSFLQCPDLEALIAFLHGNAFHRAQGFDADLFSARVLRGTGIQEGLNVGVHDARHRVIVLLLERFHGVLRTAAELPVRCPFQVFQFDQRFLQRHDVVSAVTILENLVSAGIFLRAQRRDGGRRRRNDDLFDFLEDDIF